MSIKRGVMELERALLEAVGNQPTTTERAIIDKALIALIKSDGRMAKPVMAAVEDLRAHATLKAARIEDAEERRVEMVIVPVMPAYDTSDWAWVPPSDTSAPRPVAAEPQDAPAEASRVRELRVWERLVADEPSQPAAAESPAPAPVPAANGSGGWFNFNAAMGYMPPLWRVPIGRGRVLVGGRR